MNEKISSDRTVMSDYISRQAAIYAAEHYKDSSC